MTAGASADDAMTEDEYEEALARICHLMETGDGRELDAPEEAELERLVARVARYEELHYPIDPPTPEEAERFRREQEQPED